MTFIRCIKRKCRRKKQFSKGVTNHFAANIRLYVFERQIYVRLYFFFRCLFRNSNVDAAVKRATVPIISASRNHGNPAS